MPSGPIRDLTEAEKPKQAYSDYQLLNRSGHNTIYRAAKDGRWFVLKGLRDDIVGDHERNRYLLEREYELMRSLQSPFVVQVWGMENDPVVGLCIAMEYVEGQTLDKWLQTQPSRADRKQILNELLEAVAYLHSRLIVHGDLKPANILISHSGQHVKLLDLGLSDRDDFIAKGLGNTPDFAAPEQQVQDGVIDCRTDIYALGTIVRMLFPRRYTRVVRRCHRSQSAHRYTTVAHLRSSLRRTDIFPALMIGILIVGLILAIPLASPYSKSHPSAPEQITLNPQESEQIATNPLDSILSQQHALYAAQTDSTLALLMLQEPAPESEEMNQLLIDWGLRIYELNEQAKLVHPEYATELEADYIEQWYLCRRRLVQN